MKGGTTPSRSSAGPSADQKLRSNQAPAKGKGGHFLQFRGSPPTDIVQLTIQRYHGATASSPSPAGSSNPRARGRGYRPAGPAHRRRPSAGPDLPPRPSGRREVLRELRAARPSRASRGGTSGHRPSPPSQRYFAGGCGTQEAQDPERRFIIARGAGDHAQPPRPTGYPPTRRPGLSQDDHTPVRATTSSTTDNFGGQPFCPKKNPTTAPNLPRRTRKGGRCTGSSSCRGRTRRRPSPKQATPKPA